MDTLWVPRAREVPIRARCNKGVEWPLSGGEAEGAFLRELPQKHDRYSQNLEDKVKNESCHAITASPLLTVLCKQHLR